MRFGIIVFPGSNCEHDMYHVLNSVLNISVDYIWHQESDLTKYDAMIIPGGFAQGDYLRAGAIARFSPIMPAVIKAAEDGKIILGICNGFQVLVESGLLPGALIINRDVKFLSKNVTIITQTTNSVFTEKLSRGEPLTMPIAHKQGNYIADEDTLKKMQDNGQISFTYKENNGHNPNGSALNIAGILNERKNVMGMMPHPERAAEKALGSSDGLGIFNSIIGNT